MYYMLNQEREIVAADYELLEILEINSLSILFSKVVNNDIKITKISDRKLTIISDIITIKSAFEEYTIKTTFGDIILVKLYNTVSRFNNSNIIAETSVKKPNILLDDEVKKPKKIVPSIFLDDDEVSEKSKIEEKSQLEKDLETASEELQNPKTPIEKKEPIIETIKPKKIEEKEVQTDVLSSLIVDDIQEAIVKEQKAIKVEEEIEELLDIEEPTAKEQEPVKVEEEVEDLLLEIEEPTAKEQEPVKVEEEVEDLLLEIEEPTAKEQEPVKVEEVEEIKDILMDIDKEEEKLPAKEEPKKEAKIEKKPIKNYNCDDAIEINIDERSEDMGISAIDYQEFLNEFIDKSIVYDDDLRSTDKSKREDAIEELQSIAESLEIENLEEILSDMQERDYLEEELVDIFFECLGQITTVSNNKEEETNIEEVEEERVVEEVKEEPKEEPKEESKGFGVLELDDVKPIHFDFRLEEAADDLSLPVDLIEEFVNDFIDQALDEKETFIKAFAEGDIDTIQKTGHKLKGASSNLRIIPLSETLEEIQHCENPARFEPLLKKYWGQFLSFKLFMENIAH
ncbi:collagen adhesin domain protein [hydrothermal vent metagenome]|uniref:Collagen adhesin domain protein n=1 Tax=hydrothermal vent metagenome TaxID=652676 RepID=A0A1W1EI03_9ZZZZ